MMVQEQPRLEINRKHRQYYAAHSSLELQKERMIARNPLLMMLMKERLGGR